MLKWAKMRDHLLRGETVRCAATIIHPKINIIEVHGIIQIVYSFIVDMYIIIYYTYVSNPLYIIIHVMVQ